MFETESSYKQSPQQSPLISNPPRSIVVCTIWLLSGISKGFGTNLLFNHLKLMMWSNKTWLSFAMHW